MYVKRKGGKKLNYKGHLTVGFICFCSLIISLFLSPLHQTVYFKDMPLWFIVCLFGSLAPDLDHRHSKIHEWSYIGSIFCGCAIYFFTREVYQAMIITMLLLLIVFLLSRLKHRGITHHALGFIIFTILVYMAFHLMDFTSPFIITMFGAVGYLSHFAFDYISSIMKSSRK